MLRLNQEWTELFQAYANDHTDPRNVAFHDVGVPLIAASLPVGATVVGLPLAAGMFTVGWTLNFIGHAIEKKPPSFASDRRQLIIGLLFWLKKRGVPMQLAAAA
jgi:uncharacterized membrane protein YGL010W